MRRLKTIDELYDEVKGYGLVITNDVALETALNARIETARIGELAITPRHLAAKVAARLLGEPVISDLRLMSSISEDTGLSLRRVYSDIMNFREIRSHTMEVRPFLGTLASKEIYDAYAVYPTLEKAMGLMDPEDGSISQFLEGKGSNNTVAVIGPDLFDDLDKHCIPMESDIIEIFTDEEYAIPEIRMVGNDRQLAENAIDLITGDPTDYAIVVSTQDSIADSVRSALYRRGLPFVNGMKVSDVPHVRDFIGFVSLALDFRTLRVRQVREIFSNYGGSLPPKTDNYLLSRVDPVYPKPVLLKDLMRRISEGGVTYRDVKDTICNQMTKPQVSLFLTELGMLDRTVDAETLAEIRFAVENISELTLNVQKPESERRGVLIADCKNSVYIDRPVVIYLGMEQEWNVPVVGRRYLDAERESEINAERLEALLQQGQSRLYCVNTSKNGEEPRPCLSFDIITKHPCNSFSDICGNIVVGQWCAPPSGCEDRGSSVQHGIVDLSDLDDSDTVAYDKGSFSKSSFDSFVACPRRFMFHVLLPSPESDNTQFGNLIHSFAELYATHPDAVREAGMDVLVDIAAQRYAGLSSPAMSDLDRDRIRLAMNSIRAYIDGLSISPPLDRPVTEDDRNPFMEELGITTTSSWCEKEHRMDDGHLYGVLDLMCGSLVIDYKTGKAMNSSDISKNMSLDPLASYPEFQPLIYLALARREHGTDAEFDLFYAMDNDTEAALDPDFDVDRNVRRIKLKEGGILNALTSPELPSMIKLAKEFAPHAEEIANVIADHGDPDPSHWENDKDLIAGVLKVCKKNRGMTNDKKASQALGKFADAASSGMMLASGDPRTILVPSATLDSFLEDVERIYDEKEECLRTGFPADPAPAIDCERCEYFDVCTLAKAKVSEEGDGNE